MDKLPNPVTFCLLLGANEVNCCKVLFKLLFNALTETNSSINLAFPVFIKSSPVFFFLFNI